jgi:septal ring factor EnvC (AmiA/AmiB activator)
MATGRRECPNCHVPLVRIQSKQPATKDEWFLVCPYNIKVRIVHTPDLSALLKVFWFDDGCVQGDPTTCRFIRSELQYEALEDQKRRQRADNEVSGDCYAELKEELQDLKQTVNGVVHELRKMKAKEGVNNKKCKALLDGSVLLAVVFGVFLGVLVGRLLK